MRQSLVLAPLVLLLTGCGAAVGARSDSTSDRTHEESSRVVARWHRTFPERGTFVTLGLIDYSRGIASYTHTWEDEPPAGPEIETRDASYHPVDAYSPCGPEDFGGRHWVKYDPGGTTPLSSVLIGPFGRSSVEHPADLLDLLRATTTVKRTRSAVQRGDKLMAYDAILDVGRVLKAVPELRHDSRWFTDLWPGIEEQGLPLEYAVDGHGRLRRVAVTEPTLKSVTWEVEFFDDAGVDLERPSPDDVINAEEYNWKLDHELQPEQGCD